MKILLRRCTRCIMQMSYLYSSYFPFKTFCKLAQIRSLTFISLNSFNLCIIYRIKTLKHSMVSFVLILESFNAIWGHLSEFKNSVRYYSHALNFQIRSNKCQTPDLHTNSYVSIQHVSIQPQSSITHITLGWPVLCHWIGFPRPLQTIRKKNSNQRTSEYLLEKERCIKEQIYFELLEVSCISFTSYVLQKCLFRCEISCKV